MRVKAISGSCTPHGSQVPQPTCYCYWHSWQLGNLTNPTAASSQVMIQIQIQIIVTNTEKYIQILIHIQIQIHICTNSNTNTYINSYTNIDAYTSTIKNTNSIKKLKWWNWDILNKLASLKATYANSNFIFWAKLQPTDLLTHRLSNVECIAISRAQITLSIWKWIHGKRQRSFSSASKCQSPPRLVWLNQHSTLNIYNTEITHECVKYII